MTRLFAAMLIIFLLFCGGVFYLYQGIWGNGVNNPETYELYIPRGSSYIDVHDHLTSEEILKNPFLFDLLAGQMNYKKDEVKSGKYDIPPEISIKNLLSKLRSGNQDATKLTFNNIRSLDDLAGNISKQIEADSISLLKAFKDDKYFSQYGLNQEAAATIFIPNTYQVYWNILPQLFVNRMKAEHTKFWDVNDRRKKAEELGLTIPQVHILASIVEKESNLRSEQPVVSGVYLNRINRGMPLQADPTVVFAVNDFTIKRVLNEHLLYDSPYNTYLYKGLPPGPICIPDSKTIDAVLNTEDHRYLYFCAKPGYDGGHLFAKNLIDHNRNASIYHRWLNREGILR